MDSRSARADRTWNLNIISWLGIWEMASGEGFRILWFDSSHDSSWRLQEEIRTFSTWRWTLDPEIDSRRLHGVTAGPKFCCIRHGIWTNTCRKHRATTTTTTTTINNQQQMRRHKKKQQHLPQLQQQHTTHTPPTLFTTHRTLDTNQNTLLFLFLPLIFTAALCFPFLLLNVCFLVYLLLSAI